MRGNVEQIAIRIHGAIFRERAGRRPLRHRLLPFRKLLLDLPEVVDLEAEMINAARGRLAAIAKQRQRQIAVAHINGAAALGMNDLEAENLLVELRQPRGILCLDGKVTDFRHLSSREAALIVDQEWYEMPPVQSNRRRMPLTLCSSAASHGGLV